MAIFQMVFSPTGGTQRIADIIAKALCSTNAEAQDPASTGADFVHVDLADRSFDCKAVHLTNSDICIVAVPAFGGRVPAMAVDHLAQLEGNGAAAVPVASYGNRAIDDTLLELSDILARSGFRCAAGVSAIAEHSIVRDFAAGRPDEQDAQQLASFALAIAEKLNSQDAAKQPELPGNHPYREYNGSSAKPITNDNCTQCGICAGECPVQAIPAEDPRQTCNDVCISCMRCIAVCPSDARTVPAETVEFMRQKMQAVCSVRKENELFI